MRESAHILNEFVAQMTFDFDWDIAREILPSAATEVTAEMIKETSEEPYIRSDIHPRKDIRIAIEDSLGLSFSQKILGSDRAFEPS